MAAQDRSIRIGTFVAPYHPLREDPTLAIRRDLDLVRRLDELGYDEAWIGEHHSAGVELIASPEIFIAAAAELTTHIRLGTGVISLPYHNPFMVAERMLQLDHQTRGRVMFGVGPGLLPSDADMLAIPVAEQRARMVEALDIVLRLLDGETVTAKGAWYELNAAQCQLRPFTRPRPPLMVASSFTPNGARTAGTYGLGLLCMAATGLNGFKALDVNWEVACEAAAENGRTMDRSELRVVGPMHIAETREQAREEVRHSAADFLGYFATVAPPRDDAAIPAGTDPVDVLEQGFGATIGTPDDAIATLERLWDKTGGFGAFLLQDINVTDQDAKLRSYELFARQVRPRFTGASRGRERSLDAYRVRNKELIKRTFDAANQAIADVEEQRAKRTGTGD